MRGTHRGQCQGRLCSLLHTGGERSGALPEPVRVRTWLVALRPCTGWTGQSCRTCCMAGPVDSLRDLGGPCSKGAPSSRGLLPASSCEAPVPHHSRPKVQPPHPHPAWSLLRARSQGSVGFMTPRCPGTHTPCPMVLGCNPSAHSSAAGTCWAQGPGFQRSPEREGTCVATQQAALSLPAAQVAHSSPCLQAGQVSSTWPPSSQALCPRLELFLLKLQSDRTTLGPGAGARLLPLCVALEGWA